MNHWSMRRWKSIVLFSILLLLFVSASLCLAGPGMASPSLQWVQLTTGVDGNGNILYTWVYGYYVSINGGSDNVLIQCDPATGNPTGESYISGQQVGTTKQTEQIPQVSYNDNGPTHTLYARAELPQYFHPDGGRRSDNAGAIMGRPGAGMPDLLRHVPL